MTTSSQKKASTDAELPAQDWHPSVIIAALNQAGYTLAKLAEEHGLKAGESLSAGIRRSSPATERRVSAALGLHPMVIWPSRYNADGTRKLPGSWAIESTRRARRLQAEQAGEQA